jgi:L-malate glycosyltransferase
MSRTRAKVLIVQRILPHYRTGFFRQLRANLTASSVDVELISGQERPGTVPVSVELDEAWASRVNNRYFRIGGAEICWQPVLQRVADADLVILEQANRLLANHFIQVRRRIGGTPVAFWGHGANFQERKRWSLNESVKQWLLKHVDWWFAYTNLSADMLVRGGFPFERITTVENTIDSSDLQRSMQAMTKRDVERERASAGLISGPVGLFCGGMHKEKNLAFLIEACVSIRQKVADFQMVWIGHGPEQQLVEAACKAYPWMRYLGPITGPKRAVYFALSDVTLMPGAVGLVVVDSFITARPIFTTRHTLHGPEISYLEHGYNGWISSLDVEAYASDIAEFLRNPALQTTIKAGCRNSASRYSLENMSKRFSDGILACLERCGRR